MGVPADSLEYERVAGIIERRIMNPFDVQADAQMPGFADELTQEQVRAIAVWLAGKK